MSSKGKGANFTFSISFLFFRGPLLKNHSNNRDVCTGDSVSLSRQFFATSSAFFMFLINCPLFPTAAAAIIREAAIEKQSFVNSRDVSSHRKRWAPTRPPPSWSAGWWCWRSRSRPPGWAPWPGSCSTSWGAGPGSRTGCSRLGKKLQQIPLKFFLKNYILRYMRKMSNFELEIALHDSDLFQL